MLIRSKTIISIFIQGRQPATSYKTVADRTQKGKHEAKRNINPVEDEEE